MPTPSLTRRDAVRILAALGGGAMLGGATPSHRSMLTRTVPSSGEQLPVIGLGTWQTFDVGSAPEERKPLEDVLSRFVALGGKMIDSSPMYGRAEAVLGDIIAKLNLQRELFVATKVWTTGRLAGEEQMEKSIRELRARRLDLMQVHNLIDVGAHLPTLREWKRQGRIRYLGVTHYHAGAYDRVEKILRTEKVDFLQINYSVAERTAENKLLPLAQERKVAVIVNRPFAGGDLFSSIRTRKLPEWAGAIGCTSWAQLFLKYAISHPAVTCAIPATSKVRHLEDNMAAGLSPLPDAQMRRRIVAAVEA